MPVLSPERCIQARGVRVHNLQNIDVDLPRDALVVITGVSGSGKSSLAFDTLFAEGQRRYLESLSTWTRQFLDQLERPDIDLLEGLPPTISVEQAQGTIQPRSTLATVTEIYDYLRLLYARCGLAHCPDCGRPVTQQSPQAVVDQVLELPAGTKLMILAPLVRGRKGLHADVFQTIVKAGFVRARVDGEIVEASSPPKLVKSRLHDIEAVVDRLIAKEGIRSRLQESVNLALRHGEGACIVCVQTEDGWEDRLYSTRFVCPQCSISLPAPEPRTFSFNSPCGACPVCDGLGEILPDESRSKNPNGNGVAATVCPACNGARLGPIARGVTIDGLAIHELTACNVADAAARIAAWTAAAADEHSRMWPTPQARLAAERILPDVEHRLRFLLQVGLDYVTLDRAASTLSGGEFQRARLAACLGSGLIGVCYILDEPTIGLHPRDTERLLESLIRLRDQGNSVFVVEHDTGIMRRADYLVDLGPGAGAEGGRIVSTGSPADVATDPQSVTGRYLRDVPAAFHSCERPADETRVLQLKGARLHNLQQVDLRLYAGTLTCITGVSGSGKSSLITQTLVPALRRALSDAGPPPGPFDQLEGDEHFERVIEIDQSPIGRTGRSNPATYTGLWEHVRKVFARTRDARIRGFTARRFSFNSKEGRCAECAGQGTRRIEMSFLPDVHVTCPVCRGARFNRQTLAVTYNGRTVADVLAMRIDEAARFFENFARLRSLLETLSEIGLGYLPLGQSSLTLSGGEAQRIRLATELSRGGSNRTLYVLDEPTTGLHPADVEKLIGLLQRLVGQGNTVVVVEHQLDVIAAADRVIDLGPGGGSAGGRIVAEGRPAEVARTETYTGAALAEHLAQTTSLRRNGSGGHSPSAQA